MAIVTKTGVGRSHGKVILMGEHSVVYGEPAIAIPFKALTIEAITTYKEGPVTINCEYHTGELADAPEALDNVQAIIASVCEKLGQPVANFHMEINSNIPPERGLGSSAAVAGAVVRSLFEYFDVPLSNKVLLEMMDVGEKIAHGNPSGLDAFTISSEDPVLFKKNESMTTLPISMDAYLIVGDTGEKGNTKLAVSGLRELLDKFPGKTKSGIKKLGHLAMDAKDALTNNDPSMLGDYMNRAHEHLRSLTVSNTTLDVLVKTALDNGALGAKMTGGGRGGCMIALAKDADTAAEIAQSLEKNGAKNTWIYSLETGE